MPLKAQPEATASRIRRTRGRPPLGQTEHRRILDTTADVFLEKGFERANTNEIARRAKTSKQTLYSLFPNKADLFVGVISAYTDHLFERHVEFIQSGKSPSNTLNEMGNMILGLFSAPRFLALFRILVAEAHNFPGLARQLRYACTERGYKLLAEYLKSRRIGGPHYRKAAEQFVSFVLGDFMINAMLNPDLQLTERDLRLRVRHAVRDFLRLHSREIAGA